MSKTEVWQKASAVYAEISALPFDQAVKKLQSMTGLSEQVVAAVMLLINTASESDAMIDKKIHAHFSFQISSPKPFKIGQVLNEYQLLEELGHGGMSQVFKAKRLGTEQQTPVAIKVFAPRNNSDALLNHFISEQRILSQFSHPQIVRMLHGGTTEDKTVYLVMELVEEALPIGKFCQKHKLSIKQKIKYIRQCAAALAYSHANLIVHRDIKPDNILINHNKELKIVDFGIAKLIEVEASSPGKETTMMALTPSYAAPEQINNLAVSVKTDVFSLAVVALELFLGRSVLPVNRLQNACANDELIITQAIKSLTVNKDLKNILQKALAQSPDDRYDNMQSFSDDLALWYQDRPVKAVAHSVYYRLQKFAQRHTALFTTLTSFLLFLIIGSIVSYQQYQAIKIEAEKARQVKQLILDAYQQTNPDYAKGVSITAEDILNKTAEKLSSHELNAEVKFELLQTVGIAYGQIGQYLKGAEYLKQSLLIQKSNPLSISYQATFLDQAEQWESLQQLLLEIDDVKLTDFKDTSRILRIKAKAAARNSDFELAFDYLNQLKAANLNKDLDEQLLALELESKLYFLHSKPEQGILVLEQALSNPALDPSDSLVMGMRSNLGLLYTDIGEYDKALTIWVDLINQQKGILGADHPVVADSLTQLSGVYRYKNEIEAAQKAADEAYQINLKAFGENNLLTARSLNSLAVMSYQKGEVPKAIEQMYRVISVYESTQSKDFAETLEVKANLASLLYANGRMDEALPIAEEVYQNQVLKLGETHNATIYSQQVFAKILINLNRLDEANVLAESVHKNANEYLGLKSPLTVGANTTLASLRELQNRNEEALALYLSTYEQKMLPESHPKVPQMLTSIAGLYLKTGQKELALTYYNKARESATSIFGADDPQTLEIVTSFKALK